MQDNPLEQLQANESLKSFAILLSRYIAKKPELLLEIEQRSSSTLSEGWKYVHDKLQDADTRTRFMRTVNELSSEYDWSPIEMIYIGWGQYGWIADYKIGTFGFWDNLPDSQEAADQMVLAEINDLYLSNLRKDTEQQTHHLSMFKEACFCFDNQCYIACSSLLISLIDGVLTSNSSNGSGKNRKTGEGAGKKLIEKLYEDDFFGLPGYFNLELKNYKAFLGTFFARANGFEDEPSNFNRNYLHHGMSNRIITREDCIKLFIAYQKTIQIAKNDVVKG